MPANDPRNSASASGEIPTNIEGATAPVAQGIVPIPVLKHRLRLERNNFLFGILMIKFRIENSTATDTASLSFLDCRTAID